LSIIVFKASIEATGEEKDVSRAVFPGICEISAVLWQSGGRHQTLAIHLRKDGGEKEVRSPVSFILRVQYKMKIKSL